MKLKQDLAMTSFAAMLCSIAVTASAANTVAQGNDFEKSVAEYIKKFPYQDTYDYAMKYTGGEPAKFNTWALGVEPTLVKAGEDKVVRMNNDTYYKMAFFLLDQGPVILASADPGEERFVSFQIMDDHNVNFRNVIQPHGKYTLYYGKKPDSVQGKAIESPSKLALVIVRVEVKDKNDPKDVADAKKIFAGITVNGPAVKVVPKLDLLGAFDEKVEAEALQRIDKIFETTDFSELVAGPGYVPDKTSYLQHAAGTKGGWGGPVTSHSAYETIFLDGEGKEMMGSNGTYTITTEEPPVDAFWSITIYDTERGGFLHPNDQDRYHINNTSAVKNDDGTVTFTLKQTCKAADLNCLAVPAGRFDYAARYYLPEEPIRNGKWRMPKAVLLKQ
jgi:hypothetical protein